MLRSFAAWTQSTPATPSPIRCATAGNSALNGNSSVGAAPCPHAGSVAYGSARRGVPRRRHEQLAQLQFHCIDSERHQERAARVDRGRLVRSANGHVGRDFEAKAQVNRRRSHPSHNRSPVVAGSTAGPHPEYVDRLMTMQPRFRAGVRGSRVCDGNGTASLRTATESRRGGACRSNSSRSAAAHRPRLPAVCPVRPRFHWSGCPGWRGKCHSG